MLLPTFDGNATCTTDSTKIASKLINGGYIYPSVMSAATVTVRVYTMGSVKRSPDRLPLYDVQGAK